MQQVWLINRKKNLNMQRTFWQISLPLSHEWRSQTLSKWQCDRSFSPRPDVCGYFLIHKFFFADSKISTSTRIRIQIEFARPHVSGFTLSSSANLQSDLRLKRKFYRQPVSLIKLSHETLYFACLTCLRRSIRPSYMERSFKMSNRRLG